MSLSPRELMLIRSLAKRGDLQSRAYIAQDTQITAAMQAAGVLPQVDNLTSQVNGSATLFTCTFPYIANSLKIFLDGVLQTPGSLGYVTETSPSSGTFTVGVAPASPQKLVAEYKKA